MPDLPYAWLGDVQTFLDTPEDEILRKLTAFARETGSPQLFAWDRTLRTLRDELGACLPDAARFALVLEFEVPRNGPLVQVLKYSLGRGAHAFVQDMRAFLKQYGGSRGATPPERVVVFDEAQRAWDRDRVLQRHQGQLAGSEPDLLVQIGNRVADGFALIALIGEGQEIHAGEESGIGQWADAVKGGNWNVIGPPHLAAAFRTANVTYQEEPLLSLTTSLRSHRASDVALWTGLLLEGRLDQAHRVAAGLKQAGFVLRVSRNLASLQHYVRDRYHGQPSKRFGLIASSKFRTLSQWGIRTARHPYWHYGQWFEAAPTDPHSGCQLEMALSEFGCQGLELDMPLVCWGPDCRWDGSAWVTPAGRTRNIRDPHRLRLNAYRVLLTRGRDGAVVFVAPGADMDSTFAALCRAGIEPFD